LQQHFMRNFCIIAHVDHGKSTLADRILEHTHSVSERERRDQLLDSMELERERGITIKLQAVRFFYQARHGEKYMLNLIDTPGHVDFTYEVSRSLAACEGALLVIDAAQGIEAQTLANAYMALEYGLHIVPVINKIDLPNADPGKVKDDLQELLGLAAEEAILVSAKEGTGIEEVLEAIVAQIPPPAGDEKAPLKALIFDSHYDPYRGIIPYVCIKEGQVGKGMQIVMMSGGQSFEVSEVGIFRPAMTPAEVLTAGQVGYLVAGIKSIQDARVGDTVTAAHQQASAPLPGYQQAKPVVFCGLYPVDNDKYEDLREALGRLQLNDASLFYEPETSSALGFGFRCGFLGLLHLEIIRERLEREYDLELIATAPNAVYEIKDAKGNRQYIENPAHMPSSDKIEYIAEPFVEGTFLVPQQYVGPIMELCEEKRGVYKNMHYLSQGRVKLEYYLPLGEIIYDFYDRLKSHTRGYASFDYNYHGYKQSQLVKVDIYVNNEAVDALSFIVHREKAFQRGKEVVQRLKDIIQRQLFDIPLQAVVGSRPIARETIKALRKNVTEKLYGGDVTRKRKLLEKQKAGKKRMKQVGSVVIPQEAFMAILQLQDSHK
jgi:GTP-binding protein LepA